MGTPVLKLGGINPWAWVLNCIKGRELATNNHLSPFYLFQEAWVPSLPSAPHLTSVQSITTCWLYLLKSSHSSTFFSAHQNLCSVVLIAWRGLAVKETLGPAPLSAVLTALISALALAMWSPYVLGLRHPHLDVLGGTTYSLRWSQYVPYIMGIQIYDPFIVFPASCPVPPCSSLFAPPSWCSSTSSLEHTISCPASLRFSQTPIQLNSTRKEESEKWRHMHKIIDPFVKELGMIIYYRTHDQIITSMMVDNDYRIGRS